MANKKKEEKKLTEDQAVKKVSQLKKDLSKINFEFSNFFLS